MGDKIYLALWYEKRQPNVYLVLASTKEMAKNKLCKYEYKYRPDNPGMEIYDVEAMFGNYDTDVLGFAV